MSELADIPAGRLPTTRWSLIFRAGQEGLEGRTALDKLLRLYLPALKAHLLLKMRIPAEHAEDLVQSFIARQVLERQLLSRADRSLGSRFRTFLLTALDNFVRNELRDEYARKRSPSRPVVDVDLQPVCDDIRSDEFDAEWARQVIDESLRRMQQECADKGRADIWEVFQCRIVNPALRGEDPLPYTALVERFGYRAPVQASMVLATGKRMFRRTMRRVIAEYAASETELDTEPADLFAALARECAY